MDFLTDLLLNEGSPSLRRLRRGEDGGRRNIEGGRDPWPHEGSKAGSKQAYQLPSRLKRPELKRPSAKAEGRRRPPSVSTDFNGSA